MNEVVVTASTNGSIGRRPSDEDANCSEHSLQPWEADEQCAQASPTGQDLATMSAGESADDDVVQPEKVHGRRVSFRHVIAFGGLPGLVLLVALGAAFLKWQDSSVRDAETAQAESMQAAKTSTVALLSYTPDSVDADLGAARDLLTGSFRDSYDKLIHDVVIPGAKQRRISTVVDIPAVGSISATPEHAVVLVFVNQTTTVGTDAPSATASSVKVALDKIGGRWLISGFTPV